MLSSNSSSNSITNSTVSSESAFRSLMKCVSRVISLLSTPICSLTISITFVSVSSMVSTCPAALELVHRTSHQANGGRRLYRWGRRMQLKPASVPYCETIRTAYFVLRKRKSKCGFRVFLRITQYALRSCHLHHHPAVHAQHLA